MRPRPRQLLDYKEFPILYVDDEPENLRVFELAFKREFKILTATSADEGLRILNENPVALVLSDQKMPGVTGVEFLSRVRDIDPKTVRVLVTAYGDVDILRQAINDGSIYRYIAKPWDPPDMELTLQRGIESYALEQERHALLDELTLLNRLSRSLHSEMNLDRLLSLLLSALVDEADYDGAAILFFENNGEALSWQGVQPTDSIVGDELKEIALGTENAAGLIEALHKGESQTLRIEADEPLEPGIRDWVMQVSAEEILVVPLVGQNEVIGAIAVDNRSGGHSFRADDHTFLDGLSTQAVIAIENARLVDQLRSSREQVMRADRLGTLGTMAAGLAHEINNPLVSINTFLGLAPEKRNEDDAAFWGQYHQLASAELDRIRTLVSTMSRLARGRGEGAPQRVSVDMGEVVREVATLMKREVDLKGIEIVLTAQPEAAPVKGIRDHLHQVILNLFINAIQATPEGGTVEIEIFPGESQSTQETCVRVSDSGHGIPDEHIDRIFDPFFTTKDPDKGTGLGLMIAHEIVADHGGKIEVSSRSDEGSQFLIRLPA
ncbi:MAG: ATP-binding protein [Myxococcota bacterium]|nr:ATP-binding protein [Myxococcota bacterium]